MSGPSSIAPRPWWLVALAAIALVVWVTAAAPRGLFSGDSGVKVAQVHALLESGFTERALVYDRDVDPNGRFFPYQKQDFTRVVDGERHGIYSLVFTAAAAALVGLVGPFGLVLLPLAGGVLAGAGAYRLGRRAEIPPWWAAGIAALVLWATPVFFYASQFWEHAIAAGLATAGLALVTPREGTADTVRRRRFAAAGALFAVAATVRPECYCAVAAAGIAAALVPAPGLRERAIRGALYLAGAVPLLALYWGANLVTEGVWDPAVAKQAGEASAEGALTMIVGRAAEVRRIGAWAIPAVVAVALVPAGWRRGAPGLVAHLAIAVGASWLAYQAVELSSARVLLGLVAVTPLAAYGLASGPWLSRLRAPWVFAVLYVGQVLVFERGGNAGGLQLGARFLLPALPALVVCAGGLLAWEWREGGAPRVRRAAAVASLVVLTAVSVRGVVRGGHQAIEIAQNGGEVADVVARLEPEVVITHRAWESQVLAPALLSGKRFYYVRGGLRELLARLADRGVTSFSVITRDPVHVRLPGGRAVKTSSRHPGWLDVHVAQVR